MIRDGSAGVTLVEVLVVLAIVGVAAGASVLGLGALNRGAGTEAEALRLAGQLQIAADDALLTGAPRVLVWGPSGYRIDVWEAGSASWRTPARTEYGAAHVLPGALALALATDAGAAGDAGAPLPIAPDAPLPPVRLRITGGAEAWQVRFDGLSATAAPMGP